MEARWQIYDSKRGYNKAYYAKLLIGADNSMTVPWVNSTVVKHGEPEEVAIRELIVQMMSEVTDKKALLVIKPIYRIFQKDVPDIVDAVAIEEVVAMFDRAWRIFKASYVDGIAGLNLEDTVPKPPKEKLEKPKQKKKVTKSVRKVKKVVKLKPKKLKTSDQLQLL